MLFRMAWQSSNHSGLLHLQKAQVRNDENRGQLMILTKSICEGVEVKFRDN